MLRVQLTSLHLEIQSVTHDLNTTKDDDVKLESYVKPGLIFHNYYDNTVMTSFVQSTIHLGRVTNYMTMELLELSMKLLMQDNISQRVKEELSSILSSTLLAVTNLLFMARGEDHDKHHILDVILEGVRLASQGPDILAVFHHDSLTHAAEYAQHSHRLLV